MRYWLRAHLEWAFWITRHRLKRYDYRTCWRQGHTDLETDMISFVLKYCTVSWMTKSTIFVTFKAIITQMCHSNFWFIIFFANSGMLIWHVCNTCFSFVIFRTGDLRGHCVGDDEQEFRDGMPVIHESTFSVD